MKRFSAVAVAFVIVASLLVACGGGHHHGGKGGGGGSASGVGFVFSPTAVFNRPFTAPSTTAMNYSLIPSAYAQSTSAIQTGNWSGFCDTMPPDGAEFVLFGLGKSDNPDCARSFSSFSNEGVPVINAGTLANLVIYARGTTSGNAVGRVYVNGALSPMTCTFVEVKTNLLKCLDTTNHPAVAVDDTLFVTIQTSNGDALTHPQALLGEQ